MERGKERSNIRKHGISFQEAQEVFNDHSLRIVTARRATSQEREIYYERLRRIYR